MAYLCRKFLYGAELWSGAPKYMTKQIQSQMIQVARLYLGHRSLKFSTNKLLNSMGWLDISQTLSVANARLTHQIVNKKIPEFLSYKFDPDPPDRNGNHTQFSENPQLLDPTTDIKPTKTSIYYQTGSQKSKVPKYSKNGSKDIQKTKMTYPRT